MQSPVKPVPEPAPRSGERREIEWQLHASDLRAVEAWLLEPSAWPGLAVRAGACLDLRDTYYDTEDWRIRRAGYCLRIRRAGGAPVATLKSLAPADAGGLSHRREIVEILPHPEREALRLARGPVGQRVRWLLGPTHLRPLFHVRTHRRIFLIGGMRDGIGEVALDTTVISAQPGRPAVKLLRVELELRDPGQAGAAAALVERMREQCALAPAPESKYEAGLEAAGLTGPSPPQLGAIAIDPAAGIGEVALAVLRRHLGKLLAHEPGARLGDDPEELHDMRVAARRLTGALRFFEPYLPPRAMRLREELRALGRALGTVRDLDVQIAELTAFAAKREDDGGAAEPLLARLRATREKRREQMLKTLDAGRTRKLLGDACALVRRPPLAHTRADRLSAVTILPSLILERHRKLRKAADRIDRNASAAAYHAVRLRGKRLRYAIEFVEDIYGQAGHGILRTLVRLQDLLGAHQDAQVTIRTLRAMALQEGRRLPARTLFLTGRMAEDAARTAGRMRRDFPRLRRQLRGKRWRAYRQTLEEAQLQRVAMIAAADGGTSAQGGEPCREASEQP